LERNVNC